MPRNISATDFGKQAAGLLPSMPKTPGTGTPPHSGQTVPPAQKPTPQPAAPPKSLWDRAKSTVAGSFNGARAGHQAISQRVGEGANKLYQGARTGAGNLAAGRDALATRIGTGASNIQQGANKAYQRASSGAGNLADAYGAGMTQLGEGANSGYQHMRRGAGNTVDAYSAGSKALGEGANTAYQGARAGAGRVADAHKANMTQLGEGAYAGAAAAPAAYDAGMTQLGEKAYAGANNAADAYKKNFKATYGKGGVGEGLAAAGKSVTDTVKPGGGLYNYSQYLANPEHAGSMYSGRTSLGESDGAKAYKQNFTDTYNKGGAGSWLGSIYRDPTVQASLSNAGKVIPSMVAAGGGGVGTVGGGIMEYADALGVPGMEYGTTVRENSQDLARSGVSDFTQALGLQGLNATRDRATAVDETFDDVHGREGVTDAARLASKVSRTGANAAGYIAASVGAKPAFTSLSKAAPKLKPAVDTLSRLNSFGKGVDRSGDVAGSAVDFADGSAADASGGIGGFLAKLIAKHGIKSIARAR